MEWDATFGSPEELQTSFKTLGGPRIQVGPQLTGRLGLACREANSALMSIKFTSLLQKRALHISPSIYELFDKMSFLGNNCIA